LFGSFYPRCHSLPAYFQYYDGNPPDYSPWHSSPDANFVWSRRRRVSPDVFLIPVVSDVPGTREMRRFRWARTPRGWFSLGARIGIEKIVEASRAIADRVCAYAADAPRVTKEEEIRRVIGALRDDWHVEHIALGTARANASRPHERHWRALSLPDLGRRSNYEGAVSINDAGPSPPR
jgi:hypothetical protein